MGVLAQFVPQCQPAYYGDGHTSKGTEGASWAWPTWQAADDDGNPITLTSVTGTAKIIANDLVTPVATLTVTVSGSTVAVAIDDSATIGLANGAKATRTCKWYLSLTDGTDTIYLWGAANSTFTIYPAGA